MNEVKISGTISQAPESENIERVGSTPLRKVRSQLEFLPYEKASKNQKVWLTALGRSCDLLADFQIGDKVNVRGRLDIYNYKKGEDWQSKISVVIEEIDPA